MIRSRRSKWVSGLGAVVLIGGLVLANHGGGVTLAGATGSHNLPNLFRQILDKLNEILEKLNSGGGQESNPTLRWDQVLPAAQRFVVLASFANAAVLDRETGLVWEQAPFAILTVDWLNARSSCMNRDLGNRKGWRLPSIHELGSLVDSAQFDPALTLGHPFTIQSTIYWSATTSVENPANAWYVNFKFGNVSGNGEKTASYKVWCVRGGNNADAY